MLVLDLGLPGMDGIEVCRTVRKISDCYIVMLTARVQEADRLKGLLVGADDSVTKPFSPRELVARVRAMLRRPWAYRSSPPPLSRVTTSIPKPVAILFKLVSVGDSSSRSIFDNADSDSLFQPRT